MLGLEVEGVCPTCKQLFAYTLGVTGTYKDETGTVYNRCACPECGADILISSDNSPEKRAFRYDNLRKHYRELNEFIAVFTALPNVPDASVYAKEVKDNPRYRHLSYEDLVTLVELAQVSIADLKGGTVPFSDVFKWNGTICY